MSEAPEATVAGRVAPVTVNAVLPVAMDWMVAEAVPLLVMTRVCEELVPAVMLPNESEEEAACRVAADPVPLRDTSCGLEALSVKVIAPLRVPLAVGVKVTETVQEVPTARLEPQRLVWAKSPEAAILEIESVALPVFFRVIDCAVLEVPSDWAAKVRVVADRFAPATGTLARSESISAEAWSFRRSCEPVVFSSD